MAAWLLTASPIPCASYVEQCSSTFWRRRPSHISTCATSGPPGVRGVPVEKCWCRGKGSISNSLRLGTWCKTLFYPIIKRVERWESLIVLLRSSFWTSLFMQFSIVSRMRMVLPWDSNNHISASFEKKRKINRFLTYFRGLPRKPHLAGWKRLSDWSWLTMSKKIREKNTYF
jgi:hypothetical protein